MIQIAGNQFALQQCSQPTPAVLELLRSDLDCSAARTKIDQTGRFLTVKSRGAVKYTESP